MEEKNPGDKLKKRPTNGGGPWDNEDRRRRKNCWQRRNYAKEEGPDVNCQL